MDGKAEMRRLGKEKVRRGENQSSVFFFFFFQMPPACRSRHQIVGSNCRERTVKREFVVKMDDISPAEEGKLIMWGGWGGRKQLLEKSLSGEVEG